MPAVEHNRYLYPVRAVFANGYASSRMVIVTLAIIGTNTLFMYPHNGKLMSFLRTNSLRKRPIASQTIDIINAHSTLNPNLNRMYVLMGISMNGTDAINW